MRELLDGDFPHGGDLTSITQALDEAAAVDSGCSVDDGGTNDMTVNVASGTAMINGSSVSVGSQSITLPAADGTYDRYDLIVVDSTGTATDVTGTASSTPTAPAIPADNALLAIVHVPAGVSGVTNSDIKDSRALFSHAFDATAHQTQLSYSDGADGSITDSANTARSGLIRATDYTLESGVTVSVNRALIIVAQNSITINGTIDADYAANNGGAAGAMNTSNGDPGQPGGAGLFSPLSLGGAGGSPGSSDYAQPGGDGGDGDAGLIPRHEQALFTNGVFDLLDRHPDGGAGGGGGGGGHTNAVGSSNGGNGATPGGGGAGGHGSDASTVEEPTAGGSGGGLVVLIAPSITVGGTITADGETAADVPSADINGGAGGGGSGGMILIKTEDLTENTPTYSASAGLGGTVGSASIGQGGDGADGEAGHIVKVKP